MVIGLPKSRHSRLEYAATSRLVRGQRHQGETHDSSASSFAFAIRPAPRPTRRAALQTRCASRRRGGGACRPSAAPAASRTRSGPAALPSQEFAGRLSVRPRGPSVERHVPCSRESKRTRPLNVAGRRRIPVSGASLWRSAAPARTTRLGRCCAGGMNTDETGDRSSQALGGVGPTPDDMDTRPRHCDTAPRAETDTPAP